MEILNIVGDYVDFLDLVFDNLAEVKIDVSKFDLDHIAYRCVSEQSYFEFSNKMSSVVSLANRKIIRNRNVDMYLLNGPLLYKGKQISYLEVMAPAEGDKFKEGLEHAEFIDRALNLHEFVKRYESLKWNVNSIDHEIGADVGIIFENGANAKFKNQTMKEIIELEEELKS